MRKLWMIAGVGIGFILGSRAGRQPYDQLERRVRNVRARPEVRDAIDAATEKVRAEVDHIVGQVAGAETVEGTPGSG